MSKFLLFLLLLSISANATVSLQDDEERLLHGVVESLPQEFREPNKCQIEINDERSSVVSVACFEFFSKHYNEQTVREKNEIKGILIQDKFIYRLNSESAFILTNKNNENKWSSARFSQRFIILNENCVLNLGRAGSVSSCDFKLKTQ